MRVHMHTPQSHIDTHSYIHIIFPFVPSGSRTMFDFYHSLLRPFGELLCDLETVGIYIRRDYLPIIQQHAEKGELTRRGMT